MGKVIKERSFSCNSEYRTIFETPSNTKILDAMYYPSATEDKLTEELLVVWTLEETGEHYYKETELHEVLVVGTDWELDDNLELFEHLTSLGDNHFITTEYFHIFTRKLDSSYLNTTSGSDNSAGI